MGDPKKTKKQYEQPRKLWDEERIKSENELQERYGLKNKKEIWRIKTRLKRKRTNARELLALPLEQRIKKEKELIASLNKIGILSKTATLDEVLSLEIEDFLERRLQTIVWRKELAKTPKQARQLIVHGHIKINNRKNTCPGHIVQKAFENNIQYYGKKIMLDTPKEAKIKREKLKKKFESSIKPEIPLAEKGEKND